MPTLRSRLKGSRLPLLMIGVILAQIFCAIFFIMDASRDMYEAYFNGVFEWHYNIETFAALTLVISIVLSIRFLAKMLRAKAHLENNLKLSAQSMHEVLEHFCDTWNLTAAERDVALFIFKGLNAADIAHLRGTSEGTVKAQLSSIYRKAEVQNRGELLSLIIEEIFADDSQSQPSGEAMNSK